MRGKPHTDSALWKFFRLTRISQISRFSFDGGKSHGGSTVCGFWAHTDLTDPTVSLCGWEISQMILRVWTCVGSDGGTLLSLSRTYLLDPSDKSDLSDKSDGLDIFKNNP